MLDNYLPYLTKIWAIVNNYVKILCTRLKQGESRSVGIIRSNEGKVWQRSFSADKKAHTM